MTNLTKNFTVVASDTPSPHQRHEKVHLFNQDGTPFSSGSGGIFRMLEDVKWFWLATGWEFDLNMVGCNSGDYYDNGIMTASSNVQIPAPIDARSAMVSNGAGTPRRAVWVASGGEPPLGHPDNLADGVQVGDRLAFYDGWNYGNGGVYEVTDTGETGVRPWTMQMVADLPHEDRNVPWHVELSGYGEGLAPTATLRPPSGSWVAPSFAIGLASVASGPGSFATGIQGVASAYGCVASADNSVAAGVSSVASGTYAVALAGLSIAATNNVVNTVYNTTT